MSKPHEFTLGVEVEVVTSAQETVCGRVFAHDSTSQVVVLSVAPPASPSGSEDVLQQRGDRHSYRLLNTSAIASARVVDATVQVEDLPAPTLNAEQIDRREAIAVRQAYEESQRIGINVTLEAQQLFNQLCKTLPCKWDQKTIVVMDEIRVTPPYTADSCAGPKDSAAVLARVRRVLTGERARLAKK
eukprot:CAMPEP_0177660290 /NCGR_PEP_ID=MMETSP0447-20121125/17948_1 /TAXON_ID=0 /ORGANISM="Stygamoeba regulata, Strain BSH-02190019" /LENGTH=186 /DNA_ID=CAMNT_0019165319 /DNA_START=178 /DNA_END=738 /DNA_ORIENTATION=-